jgi:hypothetical protein
MSKENDEHALEFAIHMSHLFSVSVSTDFRFMGHAFFPNALIIIVRVSVAIFPRFAQNFILFLCRIHREIASDQIHDYK